MGKKTIILTAAFIICSAYCVYAESGESEEKLKPFNISGDAEINIKGQYNRGSHNYGEISLAGSVKLFDQLSFALGTAYGKSSHSNDINVFFKTGYTPFSSEYLSPLGFSVSYIYNGFVDFQTHTHTILPVLSYNARRFGLSLGMNFRFSSFFGEAAQFESVFSLYIYYNFIYNENFRMGIGAGNFSDFYARNLGAIWLNLNAAIRLNKNWLILSEIELMQSGIDGLAVNFYGVSVKGGARFSW